MKILVTGYKGFIGSNVVDALRSHEHDIYLIEKSDDVKALAGLECDIIIHIGALARTAECNKIFDAHGYNVQTTLDLLEHIKFKKFIYISSCAVYGSHEDVITEESACRPPSVYGAQKLYSEQLVNFYGRINNVPTVSLRLFNVYGPGQSQKGSYPNVIAGLIRSFKETGKVQITGDGTQERDFVYISDVVRAITLAVNTHLDPGSHVYNVCTNQSIMINQVAAQLGANDIDYIEPRQFDMFKQKGDYSKIYKELGWKPSCFFYEGMKYVKVYESL